MSSASLVLARRMQEEADAQLARMLSLESVHNASMTTNSGAHPSVAPISNPFDVDAQSNSKTNRKGAKGAKKSSGSTSSKPPASSSSQKNQASRSSVSLPSRAIAFALIDPNPDIHSLFLQFNDQLFDGLLAGVEVKWSKRMTLCAGVCSYEGRGGLCSVRLSEPILKFRPTSDMIDTLLHEMIHAFLFVTENNRDRSGHGPQFCSHMRRINNAAGTKISVYHSFHDEVDVHRTHWWKCDGRCVKKPPYFGVVKRAMNRAPGPTDTWHADHQRSCGGTFHKIKEPEGYKSKKRKKPDKEKSKSQAAAKSKKPKPIRKPASNPVSTSKTTGNARNDNGNGKGHVLQPLGANSSAATSSRAVGGAKRPRERAASDQSGDSRLKSMLIESAKRRKIGGEKRDENSHSDTPARRSESVCVKSEPSSGLKNSRSGAAARRFENGGVKSESSNGLKNFRTDTPARRSENGGVKSEPSNGSKNLSDRVDSDAASSPSNSLLNSWLKRRKVKSKNPAVLGSINYTPMEFTPGKSKRPMASSISKNSSPRGTNIRSSSSSAPFPRSPVSTFIKSESKRKDAASSGTSSSSAPFPRTPMSSTSTSNSKPKGGVSGNSSSSAPFPRTPLSTASKYESTQIGASSTSAHRVHSRSASSVASSATTGPSDTKSSASYPRWSPSRAKVSNIVPPRSNTSGSISSQDSTGKSSKSAQPSIVDAFRNQSPHSKSKHSSQQHAHTAPRSQAVALKGRKPTESKGSLPRKNATHSRSISRSHNILDLTNSDSDGDSDGDPNSESTARSCAQRSAEAASSLPTSQVDSKTHVTCPVCRGSIPHWFINSHLDQCVGKKAS